MIKIPEKHSSKWLYIAAGLFIMTFILLVSFTRIIDISVGIVNIIAFLLLSVILTGVINTGGFLGAKIYFGTSLIFYFIAAVYMLYIAFSRTAEGWTDLVGIISFMFITVIGVITGIVLQGIVFFLSRNKKR